MRVHGQVGESAMTPMTTVQTLPSSLTWSMMNMKVSMKPASRNTRRSPKSRTFARSKSGGISWKLGTSRLSPRNTIRAATWIGSTSASTPSASSPTKTSLHATMPCDRSTGTPLAMRYTATKGSRCLKWTGLSQRSTARTCAISRNCFWIIRPSTTTSTHSSSTSCASTTTGAFTLSDISPKKSTQTWVTTLPASSHCRATSAGDMAAF
mmetsp:Transcript_20194/g.27448  ORF Transcript_20194/g.27448 Transcript_20194/m.27448 type:complete len:209 (+) Transcript_20194:466-1092(+)